MGKGDVVVVERMGVAGGGGVAPGGLAQMEDHHGRCPDATQYIEDLFFLIEEVASAFVDCQFPALVIGQPPAIAMPWRVAGHDHTGTGEFAKILHDPLMA